MFPAHKYIYIHGPQLSIIVYNSDLSTLERTCLFLPNQEAFLRASPGSWRWLTLLPLLLLKLGRTGPTLAFAFPRPGPRGHGWGLPSVHGSRPWPDVLRCWGLCGSVSTVCLYINKQANAGPYLERRKVQQLPEHFGPERPSAVLQQAVQACIDCAHQQKLVFSLVKQGYGGEMVSGKALEQAVWGGPWVCLQRGK